MPFETKLNLRIDEALMRRPRPLAWSATQPPQHDRRLLDTQLPPDDALVTPIKRNTWRTA
jgi:hypothetical protein